MNVKENLISINILGKSYTIKCPNEQVHELQRSAEYLADHIQRLQKNLGAKTLDGVTVVAALNICQELLHLKSQKNQCIDTMHDKIQSMQKRIENFLATKDEILV